MNSQLQQNLEIRKKKQKQLLIVKDTKQNKIARITKETEKTNMNIINHQE